MALPQHHAACPGFGIYLACCQRAPIRTYARMAGKAMAGDRTEQAQLGARLARIEERTKRARTPSDEHHLTPGQACESMRAAWQRKAVKPLPSDQRSAVDLADARRANEACIERCFLGDGSGPERDDSAQQRRGRAGEQTAPINLRINRHRDC